MTKRWNSKPGGPVRPEAVPRPAVAAIEEDQGRVLDAVGRLLRDFEERFGLYVAPELRFLESLAPRDPPDDIATALRASDAWKLAVEYAEQEDRGPHSITVEESAVVRLARWVREWEAVRALADRFAAVRLREEKKRRWDEADRAAVEEGGRDGIQAAAKILGWRDGDPGKRASKRQPHLAADFLALKLEPSNEVRRELDELRPAWPGLNEADLLPRAVIRVLAKRVRLTPKSVRQKLGSARASILRERDQARQRRDETLAELEAMPPVDTTQSDALREALRRLDAEEGHALRAQLDASDAAAAKERAARLKRRAQAEADASFVHAVDAWLRRLGPLPSPDIL